MPDLTQLLHAVREGEPHAAETLLPLVYDELRKLAAHKLSLLPPGQTLQATALVHEAYLKLVAGARDRWENRRHFFAAAAEAMRHILMDRTRRRLRIRHGANAERIELDRIEIPAPEKDEVLLQLNDALDELQARSPERAEIVNCASLLGSAQPRSPERSASRSVPCNVSGATPRPGCSVLRES